MKRPPPPPCPSQISPNRRCDDDLGHQAGYRHSPILRLSEGILRSGGSAEPPADHHWDISSGPAITGLRREQSWLHQPHDLHSHRPPPGQHRGQLHQRDHQVHEARPLDQSRPLRQDRHLLTDVPRLHCLRLPLSSLLRP